MSEGDGEEESRRCKYQKRMKGARERVKKRELGAAYAKYKPQRARPGEGLEKEISQNASVSTRRTGSPVIFRASSERYGRDRDFGSNAVRSGRDQIMCKESCSQMSIKSALISSAEHRVLHL